MTNETPTADAERGIGKSTDDDAIDALPTRPLTGDDLEKLCEVDSITVQTASENHYQPGTYTGLSIIVDGEHESLTFQKGRGWFRDTDLHEVELGLEPEYDCPDCDYHRTGLTVAPQDFLKHLKHEHGYSRSDAHSILQGNQ